MLTWRKHTRINKPRTVPENLKRESWIVFTCLSILLILFVINLLPLSTAYTLRQIGLLR